MLCCAAGIVEKRRADRQFEHIGPTLCDALDGEAGPRGWGMVGAGKDDVYSIAGPMQTKW